MAPTCGLLFKHHLLIEKGLWQRTLFETIIVIIMLIVILLNPVAYSKKLLYSRSDGDPEQNIVSHKLDDIEILKSLVDSKREKTKYVLAYSPTSAFAKEITEAAANTLQLNGTIGFKTESDLQNQFDERTTLAGLIFSNLKGDKVPKTLTVAIRFPSEFRSLKPFLTEDRLWVTRCTGVVTEKRDNAKDDGVQQDIYIREGFLQLQHQIFLEWYHKLRLEMPTDHTEPNVEVYNVRLKTNEEPCSTIGMSSVPEFLFNFLYLLPFLNVIRCIAAHLETNAMVHQWHYGYSFCMQWCIIFLVAFLRLIILGIVLCIVIFLYWSFSRDLFSGQAILLMILFILVYTIALVVTAMVFAKIFLNAVNAVLFGLVMWLLNYGVFAVLLQRYWDVRGFYSVAILLMFFNNQFTFGMQLFHRSIDLPDDVGYIDNILLFASAICCILIYLLILVIVQWRVPGRLLSRRVVAHKRKTESKEDDARLIHFGRSPTWHNFEFGDVGSYEMMRLRQISTTHQHTERKVLKQISMRLYKGEIYVLLGHIGSGKITMVRVMCGLKYPMRGTISVKGEDFHANMKRKRQILDFRFQESGLSPFLTVEQTIAYHVRLKLRERDRFSIELNKWLEYLDPFIEKRRQLIKTLKLGATKLVALCCALSGDTKIMILDEPTDGLSNRETQAFWDIIMREKEDRAILVTTYSVDEAERIADRIGILSMGVLEASGTPFFLRAKFSSSIELVLIKKPHVPDAPITAFLEQFIPHIEPENEIGDSLTYKIDVEHRPMLQRMLIHLENDRKMLGIENVRIVGSEVSDIYMKLVTSFRLQQQIIPDVTQTFKYQVVSKKERRKQQMRAMFYKKMIHTAPNVWPILMIFICFVLIVIITRLAVVMAKPGDRSNSIRIGFIDSAGRDYIPNINDCGYIDIKTLEKTQTYIKSNVIERIFEAKSLGCQKGQYQNDLKKREQLSNLGAVEADGTQKINGYISKDFFHSAPMTLNLLHNIILKMSYPKDKDAMYIVENHPMPTPLSMKINLLDNEIAHINAPLVVGCVLPMMVSVFILPIVEEHITQMRILQVIAGIGLEIYWGINLFWDLFTFFIYAVIIVIIIAFSGIGNFGAYENILILMLITIFGLAALPITYLLSMYVNESMMRAFLASVLVQSIIGLVLYIIYWDVANSNVIFFYGASISPGFSLLDGISNIYTKCLERLLCEEKCAAQAFCTPANMAEVIPNCNFDTYFKWADPGILSSMTFMLLAALIGLLLIFWIELHRKEKMFHTSKDIHKLRTVTYPFDDADVADVKMKIAEADMSKCKQSVFLVDQVEAALPSKGNKIETVSFALNKYMSMGIFGPRNSGKSHLIRQLVGVDGFAFGEIYVRGLDFKYDLDKIQAYVGYCPQHNGLLDDLTPREHIRLLCMIRGVPDSKIGEKMHDLCLMLNMTGWMHRKCHALTPEKRRKLNVALSLIAYNKVLVLDEPTRGMPSTTRREIWNILRYIRYCGKTIIFATTDELECKILADFIILYQDNEMLAIGSMQYLRYKYSHGFYLEVRLIRDGATVQEAEANLRKDVDNLARFVTFLHDRSEMVGRLHNWFKFYVPVGNIVYSFLYGAMEKNKVRLNVYDYCIYQASMGNVISQLQDTRADLKRRQSHGVDSTSAKDKPSGKRSSGRKRT